MKKLIALALIVAVFLCSTAIAEERSGISVAKFEKYMNASLKEYAFSDKPKLVFNQDAENVTEYHTTLETPRTTLICFKDSDIIEVAYSCISKDAIGTSAWAEYTLAFLSAGVQVSDSAARRSTALLLFSSSSVDISIDSITPSGAFWFKNKQDDYILYTLFNTDGSLVLAYVHEDSVNTYDTLYPLFCSLLGISETGFLDEHSVSAAGLNTEGGLTLSIGEWECPAHIASGEYSVTPVKSATIYVYRGGELIIAEYLDTSENDEIGRLVLEAGDRIEISSGKLEFRPFE